MIARNCQIALASLSLLAAAFSAFAGRPVPAAAAETPVVGSVVLNRGSGGWNSDVTVIHFTKYKPRAWITFLDPNRNWKVTKKNCTVTNFFSWVDTTEMGGFKFTVNNNSVIGKYDYEFHTKNNNYEIIIPFSMKNHSPAPNQDNVAMNANDSITVNVLANDLDADGQSLTVTGLSQPMFGVAVLNDDNTVTYTPVQGFYGTDSLQYAVTDGQIETVVDSAGTHIYYNGAVGMAKVMIVVRDPSGANLVPDTRLAAAIRKQLDMKEGEQITAEKLLQLTVLDAANSGVSVLAGLEYCANLQDLNLAYNNISDITALNGLPALRILDLGSNIIGAASPLASLPVLEHLYLSGNPISDLSFLSTMTTLRTLHVARMNTINIAPLATLTGLTTLDVSGNGFVDPSALSGLVGLKTLLISDNAIMDATPLASLTSLEELNFSNNVLTNAAPFSGMTQLQVLSLSSNKIADISPLQTLKGNVLYLYLASNGIADVSTLAEFSALRLVDLSGNAITDANPLATLSGLSMLILSSNQLDDNGIAKLTGPVMSSLTSLRLASNKLVDIDNIATFTKLAYLDLQKNSLSSYAINYVIPRVKVTGCEVVY